MAKLHSLIKFKRHELDEKRQILGKLNEQLTALHQKKQRLLDNLAREKNLAAVDVDIARSFGPFLSKTLAQCGELDKAIHEKMQEIQAATHVVQDVFMEVKKLEVTQENRDNEEAAKIKRVEGNNLDEMGLEGFRRNSSNGERRV